MRIRSDWTSIKKLIFHDWWRSPDSLNLQNKWLAVFHDQPDEAQIARLTLVSFLISITSMKPSSNSLNTRNTSDHSFRMAFSQVSWSYLWEPQVREVPVKTWIRSLSSRPCCQEITGLAKAPLKELGFSTQKKYKKKYKAASSDVPHIMLQPRRCCERDATTCRVCFSSGSVYYAWSRGHSVATHCFNFPFLLQFRKAGRQIKRLKCVCEITLLVCNRWRLGCRNLWETEGKGIPNNKDERFR